MNTRKCDMCGHVGEWVHGDMGHQGWRRLYTNFDGVQFSIDLCGVGTDKTKETMGRDAEYPDAKEQLVSIFREIVNEEIDRRNVEVVQ